MKSKKPPTLKLSLLQYPLARDGEINWKRVSNLLEKTSLQKPDLIILPEMGLGGPITPDERQKWALFYQKKLVQLQIWCKAKKIGCIFTQLEASRGRVYNTACCIDKQGKVKARYRKIHLFSLGGETQIYHHGKSSCVFNFEGFKLGLVVCYDIRFPELIRHLASQGVDLLIVSAQWPRIRSLHWDTLLKARAIENQFFVAAVNRLGQKGTLRFAGGSQVIGPWGDTWLHLGSGKSNGTSIISRKELENVRTNYPFLKERRWAK